MSDETNDAGRTSWVPGADGHAMFPLQNLPCGVFSVNDVPRVGVAIGDMILDMAAIEAAGLLRPDPDLTVFDVPALNPFMSVGRFAWGETRRNLSRLLGGEDPRLKDDPILSGRALVRADQAKLHMPFAVAEFTDFHASREHACNLTALLCGPDHALPANWDHMPIAHNGRASTVIVSGTGVRRPMGQLKAGEEKRPRFAPSAGLDFELELGAVVGVRSAIGTRLSTSEADAAIFGYVLLNDWSARDIQHWECVPLGPFQGKVFATTISPWVVTTAALAPFRAPPPPRRTPLLPHLREGMPHNLDIELGVSLQARDGDAAEVTRTNARHLYFSAAQQLAHHSACGCAMSIGDLLGSGTISGDGPGSYGSLFELTWNGSRPLKLPGGAVRTFLEDGDTVTMRGWCSRAGRVPIGFGTCAGVVQPAM